MTASRIVVFALAAFAAVAAPALADEVLVTPGTIVFDDTTRTAELLVANTGDATSIFRLQPTFFLMGQDGGLKEVTGTMPPNSALNMVRFSPKQFELKPGESQVVRLATRLPPALAKGEYRVHLRVANVGDTLTTPSTSTPEAVQAQIKIRVTRAVRILVRHGVVAGHAALGTVSASRSGDGVVTVTFGLDRSGDGSSQGEYDVTARNTSTSARTEMIDRGVLVYADLPKREVTETFAGDTLKGSGEVCVRYTDKGAKAEERCVRISSP